MGYRARVSLAILANFILFGGAILIWAYQNGKIVIFGSQAKTETSESFKDWPKGQADENIDFSASKLQLKYDPTENWLKLSPSSQPSKRARASMVYLEQKNVLLFGGRGENNQQLNDTWLFDGENWTSKETTSKPSSRYGAGIAYDKERKEVVLFGGGDPVNKETWVFDGTNWTLKSPSSSPPPRRFPAMAYDEARKQVVLFGGYGPYVNEYGEHYDDSLGDTWVWDGNNWTQKTPAQSPSRRDVAGMAYDSKDKKIVLYGGSDPKGQALDDTWLWDGEKWTQATPAHSPAKRKWHAMALDFSQGRVILFGGWTYDGGWKHKNDTWLWDGKDWTLKSFTTSPSERSFASFSYAGDGKMLLFGGGMGDYGNSFIESETWFLTQKGYKSLGSYTSPSFGNENVLEFLSFTPLENKPEGTSISYQFSGSSDGVTWSDWNPPAEEEGGEVTPPTQNKVIVAFSDGSKKELLVGSKGEWTSKSEASEIPDKDSYSMTTLSSDPLGTTGLHRCAGEGDKYEEGTYTVEKDGLKVERLDCQTKKKTEEKWSPKFSQKRGKNIAYAQTKDSIDLSSYIPAESKYLKVKISLASLDSSSTPSLNGFSISYNLIGSALTEANIPQAYQEEGLAGVTKLVSTGTVLWFNLLITLIISGSITYLLLRRRPI